MDPDWSFPKEVAGIRFPDTTLCKEAARFAHSLLPPVIYNHLLRTYVFGTMVAERRQLALDSELFFLGAVLHDLGLSTEYHGRGRFEVVGADAADEFLAEKGVSPEKREIVWDAIALHTASGIADRKRPEIAMVHVGAGVDVLGIAVDKLPAAAVAEMLDEFPRLDFKNAFFSVLLQSIAAAPDKTALTWLSETGREHVHGYSCPTFRQVIQAAPFSE